MNLKLVNRLKDILASMPEWAVIALIAASVGFLSVLPYYLAGYSLGTSYQGMPLLAQDSEGEYLSQVHEIIEGRFMANSPIFHEYKEWPSVVPSTGEWFYYLPHALLGMSAVAVDMLYKLLLPGFLFVLIYILIKNITNGSRLWGVIAGLLVTFGYDLVSLPFLHTLVFGNITGGYLSLWTRPINPVTGMLALAGYMICLYQIYSGKSRRFLLPGIIIGFMVGYFFSFVYAGILTITLAALGLWFRKPRMYIVRLLSTLIVGAIIVVILVGPLAWQLITERTIGGLNDPQWQGLFYTHILFYNKTSLLVSVVFALITAGLYIMYKRKLWLEDWWQFSLALLITNQAVYNIQIILGWTIWPQHFVQYTNVAIMVVMVSMVAQGIRAHFPRIAYATGIVIIALVIFTVSKTLPTYSAHLPMLERFQTYRPIMNWLNEHNDQDCVVSVVQDSSGTTLQLYRFIPAYTNCDMYNSFQVFAGVPRDRVFHSMLVWLWFKGVTPAELPKFLDDHNFWIRTYLFRDWRDIFCCGTDAWLNKLGTVAEDTSWYASQKQRVEESYGAFLKEDIYTELNTYRLDYIIVDKTSRVRSDLVTFPWLTEVYDDPGYTIYTFASSTSPLE